MNITANDKFFVQVPTMNQDSAGYYKRALIEKIQRQYPHLTIAGLDAPFHTPKGNYIKGVDYAPAGSLLTFGTAKHHDVNWVRNPEFAAKKGYTPVYDMIKDWENIDSKLRTFANNRRPVQTYRSRYSYQTGNNSYVVNGSNVTVTDNFVFIDNKAYPRRLTETSYRAMPVASRRVIENIVYVITKIG